jgi:hypothetical protein
VWRRLQGSAALASGGVAELIIPLVIVGARLGFGDRAGGSRSAAKLARGDGAKMARESAGISRDWVVVGHRRSSGDRSFTSGFVALGDP